MNNYERIKNMSIDEMEEFFKIKDFTRLEDGDFVFRSKVLDELVKENEALNKITDILGCPTAATARRLKHTIKELNNRNIKYRQAIDKIKGKCQKYDAKVGDTIIANPIQDLYDISQIINEVEE